MGLSGFRHPSIGGLGTYPPQTRAPTLPAYDLRKGKGTWEKVALVLGAAQMGNRSLTSDPRLAKLSRGGACLAGTVQVA